MGCSQLGLLDGSELKCECFSLVCTIILLQRERSSEMIQMSVAHNSQLVLAFVASS
jgi:hypothetical protein